MRLGILGGTFNPIHVGHLRVAEELLGWLALDEILFVPAGQPLLRPREGVASALHRYTMVALATTGMPRFLLSESEVRRPGPSYSVDTVEEVRAGVGESARLFFILGSDSFLMLREWREPQRLLKHVALVLVPRGGQPLDPEAEEVVRILTFLGRPRWVGSVASRLEPGDVGVAPVTSLPISGREIRRRISSGEPIRGLVPPLVEEYIQKHRLYREVSPPSL